jgi:hypothetical protein
MGGMERASSTLANHFDSIGIKVNFVSILKKPRFFDINTTIEYSEPRDFNVKKLNLVKTLIWLRREIKIVNAQCVAFDFVFEESNNPLIVEINYGFAHRAYNDCPGWWTRDLQFIEGKIDPCGWMVEEVLRN